MRKGFLSSIEIREIRERRNNPFDWALHESSFKPQLSIALLTSLLYRPIGPACAVLFEIDIDRILDQSSISEPARVGRDGRVAPEVCGIVRQSESGSGSGLCLVPRNGRGRVCERIWEIGGPLSSIERLLFGSAARACAEQIDLSRHHVRVQSVLAVRGFFREGAEEASFIRTVNRSFHRSDIHG